MAPRFAGALEHGAKGRIIAHQGPRAREIKIDRQRIGRTARPASIGNAAASPESPDLIVVLKVGGYRCFAAFLCRCLKLLKVGCVTPGRGSREGKTLRDRLASPMPPVIEQVGGLWVVAWPNRSRRWPPGLVPLGVVPPADKESSRTTSCSVRRWRWTLYPYQTDSSRRAPKLPVTLAALW